MSLQNYISPPGSANAVRDSERVERLTFFALLRQRWHAEMHIEDPFSNRVPFAIPADPYVLVQIVKKRGGFDEVKDWAELARALGLSTSRAETIKRFYESRLMNVVRGL